ncbi:MAG: glycosyltransferase family protein [Firmicutes bacterium]|nr:glycosyltransferase family protein [Bacillota bacterium]
MKIVATIEARMTSTRLPGKVLLDLCGKPALQHIVERLRRSRYLDDVVVATTVNATDDPVVQMCKDIGCSYYRGSEEDVLLRVLEAARSVDADLIVEITGDCPVIDWRHVDRLIEMFFSGEYDYVSNVMERSFPRGFDTQVFPVRVLDEVNRLTQDPVDHEHVSYYIYNHPERYRLLNWRAEGDAFHPELEITLDTPEDYRLIKAVYEGLYRENPDFSAVDVIRYLLANQGLAGLVSRVRRKQPHGQ